MAEESILGLLFEIGADPSRAIAATGEFRDRASTALAEFEQNLLSTMTKSLGITKEFAIGMGVAVGAVAGLGIAMFELADKAAEVGGKMFEAAEKTNFSAASLSALNAMSKQTGESFDGLTVAIGRASINIEKAIEQSDAQKNVLRDVMGSAQALSELGLKPMEERFQTIIHRIFELTDAGERNRALSALLGRGWQENFSTLQLLAEQGYGPAIEKAKAFGIYFDDAAASKARQYELAWKDLKNQLSAAATVIGSNLLPAMAAILRNIIVEIEYVKQYGVVFDQMMRGNMTSAVTAAAFIATHGKSLGDIMAKVEKDMAALATLQTKTEENRIDHTKKTTAQEIALKNASVKAQMDLDYKLGEESMKRMADNAGFIVRIQEAKDKMFLDNLMKQNRQTLALEDALAKAEMEINDKVAKDRAKKLHDQFVGLMEITKFDIEAAAKKQARDKEALAEERRIHNDKMRLIREEYTTALGALDAIAGGLKKHHALEVALTLARAVLKAAEEHAFALSAFAFGHVAAGILHEASAAAFLGMGAYSAFAGGGGGSSAPSAAVNTVAATAPGPVAASSPGSAPGGNLHVMILGDAQKAQYLAGVLDHGVRFQGVQLTASHTRQQAGA